MDASLALIAFENTAQTLAFLSIFGLLACVWQVARGSQHPMHLLAFALMLLGTFLREIVALSYDPQAWTATALILSATARIFKIAGALLFVRLVTVERCGEWAWIAVAIGATVFSAAMPH